MRGCTCKKWRKFLKEGKAVFIHLKKTPPRYRESDFILFSSAREAEFAYNTYTEVDLSHEYWFAFAHFGNYGPNGIGSPDVYCR